ncbi:putative cytochrome p450 [Annulohypoxylon truncatum]|uniref:putative cytochrome p450 n=1 Tax=Annulohypoxylon truncatum TaxID=327061 RepID=UPI0020076099|nr:putative cytochrome p450 [Annulohypoxylon truncatum]KAI1211123.1 putative cytochrome p450 [Annulohypoxylon truncatum]
MSSHQLSNYIEIVAQKMIFVLDEHTTISSLLGFVVLVWVSWWCWRFAIHPKLHPDEPKELPYLIPILGHGQAFFQDSNGLLARARRYFSNDNEPFALTAFGHTFYVVTNAKQSAEVYRNMDSLSFEEFVQTLMRINGNDEDTIRTVYSPLPTEKDGFPNPDGLSLGVLAQRMHKHQLYPGENMVVLQRKAQDWINRKLNLDVLGKECTYSPSRSPEHIQLPLYQWTSDYFVRLGQYIYFGDVLHQVDPDYATAYVVFDEVIWKMLYQYPSFLCRDMTKPRDHMMASLKAYFQIPPNQRRDQAAWIINAMEDEMRSLGVDDENLAVMIFHLYFAINTNARKTSFWMLTHLMRNPSYLAAFRSEMAPAFRDDELVDVSYIQDATKCPQIDAIWHETLRVAGWAASVRLVTRDVTIGGKRMRSGNRVMVPHRLLHFDQEVFGDDIDNWRPERWLGSEAARKLPNSPSWRPFGGGKTKCSGRFLAKYFVTAFVATVLHRFDIEMVGDPPMPEADVGRPVLGIISVKEGQDYMVSITKRKKNSG